MADAASAAQERAEREAAERTVLVALVGRRAPVAPKCRSVKVDAARAGIRTIRTPTADEIVIRTVVGRCDDATAGARIEAGRTRNERRTRRWSASWVDGGTPVSGARVPIALVVRAAGEVGRTCLVAAIALRRLRRGAEEQQLEKKPRHRLRGRSEQNTTLEDDAWRVATTRSRSRV